VVHGVVAECVDVEVGGWTPDMQCSDISEEDEDSADDATISHCASEYHCQKHCSLRQCDVLQLCPNYVLRQYSDVRLLVP